MGKRERVKGTSPRSGRPPLTKLFNFVMPNMNRLYENRQNHEICRPLPRARPIFLALDPGLTPQALCCRALREMKSAAVSS